ncbi:MAG: tRNA (adenosine(37)-N6)-threonylcarbamoyltransferase complex dimerization subunit type 1 TsaB [Verrucomicrobiae bacterium]|nr:tRNA (adenosine(37)-N6)-threonylcarbamoyltransferase complex dimerization subunit type 1 TsaB [Verrucomicrobiae bacterium]
MKTSRRWFAIESSSSQLSLALGEGETVLREVSESGNASRLIEPLYRRLGVRLEDVDFCVIGQGPGSYNGLRVGYAFLKGLLCADEMPVCEIPTPLALAAQAASQLKLSDGDFLALNDARREEIFGAKVELRGGALRQAETRVAPPSGLEQIFGRSFAAVISYELKVEDFPFLAGTPWLCLFPTASATGALACRQDFSRAPALSSLGPHYVRVAVPGRSSA